MLTMKELPYPEIGANTVEFTLPDNLLASNCMMGDRTEVADSTDEVIPKGATIRLKTTENYGLVIYTGSIWRY